MFDNDDNHLISCNAIYSNAGLAIDLFPPGVNVNDAGDVDDGANEGLNFPEITTFFYGWGSGNTNVDGTLDTENPELCEIQVFKAIADDSGHGEALEYISSTFPSAAGEWYVSIPDLDPEQFLTFIAIDQDNNTSEFSITRNSETIANFNIDIAETQIDIFPNPAKDYFYVNGTMKNEIQLYSTGLNFICTLKCDSDNRFSTQELNPGVYLIRLEEKGLQSFKKLIIVK
jgi:hypothetical protein